MYRKADILLILLLLVLGFLPLLFFSPAENTYAEITVDGKLERRVQLSAHQDETFLVETSRGRNQIRIRDGAIEVIDADCPDRVCVKSPPIRQPGEIIACLPHKLLIEIRKR